MFRFADGAVFQTEGARKFYPNNLQKKSVIIHNPAFKKSGNVIPYGDKNDTIAFSGRLFDKQKNLKLLIDTFSLVAKDNDTVKLFVYGDGPDREMAEKLAIEKGLEKRVVFCGNVENVEEKVGLRVKSKLWCKLLILHNCLSCVE